MFSPDIISLAERVIKIYAERRLRVVTAESCTGGLVSGALTAIAGSSAVLDRGFVTYSNGAKSDLLGVAPDLINLKGAVSGEVAEAMADGALAYSQANVAVSVTGIAGPEGGSLNKPVGLVCFGLATREGLRFHYRCTFDGDREDVRLQAVQQALKLLLSAVEKDKDGAL